MAKLGSFFGLCPLIDQKSLLGISEDAKPGYVIVTLGKNMAIKYKLSDQKQIDSWSTKEKLSSPVIYDRKKNRYVAIFNQQFIRMWTEENKNLDKIKKVKFSLPLHTILYSEEEPIVVFKNGQTHTLSYTLENRANISQTEIIKKSCSIEDSTCLKINDQIFVGLLVKENDEYFYILLQPNLSEENASKIKRIGLNRPNLRLNGHVIMNTENGPGLFTFWSDGRLYCYYLNDESTVAPGYFFSVVENLSRQSMVSMVPLDDTYIAMYGADHEQERATLQIYNIRFKITQSCQHFKMFTEGSQIWAMNGTLLLTVGQNLAAIPFVLDTEQLAALVGSHRLCVSADQDISIVTEVVVGDWGPCGLPQRQQQQQAPVPQRVRSTVTELLHEGWPESAICEHVFPLLMQQDDVDAILECLDYFIDVPEHIVVRLLAHCLQGVTDARDTGNAAVAEDASDADDTADAGHAHIMTHGLPQPRARYLDRVLSTAYSDALILPHLRAELRFDVVLVVLQYLCFLLSEHGHTLCRLSVTESEGKVIEWGCLLLDAYYQNLLLSKDAAILESLQRFKSLVDAYFLCLDDLKKAEPVLSYCQFKHQTSDRQVTLMTRASLKYSIEKLKLY